MPEQLDTEVQHASSLKTLPHSLDERQVMAALRQFRLTSSGRSEVRLGAAASRSVMISSISRDSLEDDWRIFCAIVNQIAATVSAGDNREKQRFPGSHGPFHRPMALVESPVIARLPDGSVCLLGAGARLLAALDQRFLAFAAAERATPIDCPPIWHGDQLTSFGYGADSPNILQIKRVGDGPLLYWQLAACNNIWLHLSGTQISGPARYTTRGTCCRGEGGHYFLLERMRSFSMREITCAGTPDEIAAFRGRALDFLASVTQQLGLSGALTVAHDPFFLLERDPAGTDGSKIELRLNLYDEKSIACASVNVHGPFFAETLRISGPDPDTPVWTSCVAFGLERWVWAVLSQFGPDPAAWPQALTALIEAPGW